jgi:hypothetical protein
MAGESIRFNASLNTAGFDSGAARLQQVAAATSGKVSASFASMGASIAGVIAPFVGLYAAVNSVKNALDMGGRLNDLSKTTGETAGNLAILERAFDNAGVGSERMGMAIASMSNFMTDFQTGSKTASATMDRLGLSMADLAGKSPIEQMRVFMAAIADIQDPALRTAMAMDVFKKAGKEIVPLASDFAGELANATAELGSTSRLLTENGAALDDLGDKLTNSVGNKLTELAVGLAAGATGANDFVTALSKIDAAGFGEKLGNSIRAAFAAPQEYVMAIGEFLLAGVLKAANALDAAMRHAVNVYYELMQNPGFWSGFFGYLEAGFAKVGEVFTTLMADGIKSVLSAMDWNPLWKPFTGLAKDALDNITAGIRDAGIAAENTMDAQATKMEAAWNGATASSKYVYEDTFGAEQHLQKASEHMAKAEAAAGGMKESSAAVSENLATGSAELSKALAEMRGFDLGGGAGDPFKVGYPGSDGFPASAGSGAPQESPTPSGGNVTGGRLGPSVSGAPMSENMRVAELRGAARQAALDRRASELAARGLFRSAINAQDQGQRAFDRAMQSASDRDMAAQYDFAGRSAGNIGEAMKSVQDELGKMEALDRMRNAPGYDPQKGETENMKNAMRQGEFDDAMRAQAKTPEERKQEEEAARSRHASSGGGGDKPGSQSLATESTLQKILNKIQERPILVA